jgi:UDP-N-acetylmuramate dehydrogenase
METRERESLAPHTTFKIGGEARHLARVSSVEEAREAIAFAHGRALRIFVLGGGSNLLASDAGFDGLVIKNEIMGIEARVDGDDALVSVGAGEPWDGFVAYCVEKGLWGVENLSAIPGTVGAAPVQNIGAYGVEVKDLVVSVGTIDMRTGEARTFTNAECDFSYRESFFKTEEGRSFMIASVLFRLSAKPRPNLSYRDVNEYFIKKGVATPTIGEIRAAVTEIRAGKFPSLDEVGTAGSFWKNPIIPAAEFARLKAAFPLVPSFPAPEGMAKVPLAWILDHACGLKGHKVGKVGLYKNQPLVLYAEKGATSGEVEAFATAIERAVREKTGIAIEREVKGLSC